MVDLASMPLTQRAALVLLVGCCGLLGLRRGLRQEIITMVGIGVAFAVAARLSEELTALVQSEARQRHWELAIFGLLVLASYLMGARLARAGAGGLSRLIGVLVGAVNGFIIHHYLFARAFVASGPATQLSGAQLGATMASSQTIAKLVTLLVMVVIALGLYGAARRRSL